MAEEEKSLVFKRIILALSLLFVAHSAYAQQNPRPSDIIGMRVLGQPVASEYGKWEMRASSQVTTAGTATTVSIDAATATVPEGMSIMPITTRIPLRIVDGANSETVTPTAVSCAQNSGVCTFTAVFANTHANQFRIRTGSNGLQEAIDDTLNGGVVLVTQGWAGTTSMIIAATGNTLVGIRDMRNGSDIFYAWDGTDYAVVFNIATSTYTDLTVTDALTVGGAAVLNGTLGVTGAATFASTLTISSLTANRLVSTGTGGLLQTTISSANAALSISDETGSGLLVFGTSPALTTPSLGIATATSINKVALTEPATSATLTIADGKTLTASNTLAFTGTDTSSVAFGAGGTVAYTADNLSVFAATTSAELAGVVSNETGSGLLVFGTAPSFATSITLGAAGGTTGSALFSGSSSGVVTVQSAGTAGTWTLTLPTSDGNSGQYLQTDGGGVTVWAAAGGGTGNIDFDEDAIVVSGAVIMQLALTTTTMTIELPYAATSSINTWFRVPSDADVASPITLVLNYTLSAAPGPTNNQVKLITQATVNDTGAAATAGDTITLANSTVPASYTATLNVVAGSTYSIGDLVRMNIRRDTTVANNALEGFRIITIGWTYTKQ